MQNTNNVYEQSNIKVIWKSSWKCLSNKLYVTVTVSNLSVIQMCESRIQIIAIYIKDVKIIIILLPKTLTGITKTITGNTVTPGIYRHIENALTLCRAFNQPTYPTHNVVNSKIFYIGLSASLTCAHFVIRFNLSKHLLHCSVSRPIFRVVYPFFQRIQSFNSHWS